jgi:ankyrin repeat protein
MKLRDNDLIFNAARKGDVEGVRRLISVDHRLLHATDSMGTTPLMMAAMNGHEPLVDFIIGETIMLGLVDRDGFDAASLAACYGHMQLYEKIKKANGSEPKPYVLTNVLRTACLFGRTEIVLFLLSRFGFHSSNEVDQRLYVGKSGKIGSDGKSGNTGETGETSGSSIIYDNPFLSMNPLVVAAENNQLEVVRILLDHGIDVDERRYQWGSTSALTNAAAHGNEDICRLLIDRGADVESTEKDGLTPLMYAAATGGAECVRLLIERGADVNAVSESGYTPLMYTHLTDAEAVVTLLVESGAHINYSNDQGKTALMIAAENASPDMVRALLRLGADSSMENVRSCKAIHCAMMNPNPEVLRLLFEHGEDPNDDMPYVDPDDPIPVLKTFDEMLAGSPEALSVLRAYRNARAIEGVIRAASQTPSSPSSSHCQPGRS